MADVDVMRVLRNSIRGTLIAPPGRKLVIADFANVEGRVAAWLAGEQWKLDAFRDYDAGTGPDLYKLAYARSFGVSADFDHKTPAGYSKRQIGKVEELMLQYQGGVGAFITGAATYNIDLEQMADAAFDSIPVDVMSEARGMWDWTLKKRRSTFGLSQHVFTVCDSLKRMWRMANPAIASFWPEIEAAVRDAINYPGKAFDCRSLKMRRDGAWLRILLPSGNYLCYPSPQVDEGGKISYMGMNQYSRKWCRIGTYGGKVLENGTQSFSGDLLKGPMPDIEDAGYGIVLSVHDEIVSETPDEDRYTAKEMGGIMVSSNRKYKGLPLAVDGFETYRYCKKD